MLDEHDLNDPSLVRLKSHLTVRDLTHKEVCVRDGPGEGMCPL